MPIFFKVMNFEKAMGREQRYKSTGMRLLWMGFRQVAEVS